uniref:Uncharacterized protein n=1 Tax=Salarias fasciatus TaxID=181472 RepID=A0A672G617_SALFA
NRGCIRLLLCNLSISESDCSVQSCEEGGSGGAYLEPLVALAQNGANMHNVLGPACIFLRKGFAESRQAVRKSRKYHVHACRERLAHNTVHPQ